MLEYYIIGALATAFWAVITIIPKARRKLFEENNLDHIFYRTPKMQALVLFGTAFVLAPFFFIGLLSPGTVFIDTYIDVNLKK
jgi:hypothetical protein